jgi:hypothetical protein
MFTIPNYCLRGTSVPSLNFYAALTSVTSPACIFLCAGLCVGRHGLSIVDFPGSGLTDCAISRPN